MIHFFINPSQHTTHPLFLFFSHPVSQVREQIRTAFPERPWIDVRSKADLPLEEGFLPEEVPEGTLHVSVHEGRNIDELKAIITAMVAKVAMLEDAPVADDGFVAPGER